MVVFKMKSQKTNVLFLSSENSVNDIKNILWHLESILVWLPDNLCPTTSSVTELLYDLEQTMPSDLGLSFLIRALYWISGFFSNVVGSPMIL